MKKDDAEKLMGAYRRALHTPEGQLILDDLAKFCGLIPENGKGATHMAGAELSHAECAYRNGQQDLWKYIDGMASEQ